jgi:prepilin-type N-terminal cleavage/methylation domain-containing protein
MKRIERSKGRNANRRHRQAGFSLSELLVVVAIIGVIVLAALPAFGEMLKSWKVRSEADNVLAELRGVRQLAVAMHQDITVTFTPAPANTYSYFHPIQKKTLTKKLPGGITMATNPTASYAPVFKINGSITNPSTPSVSAPTANFVDLQAIIDANRTDHFKFGFSAAGQVNYTR